MQRLFTTAFAVVFCGLLAGCSLALDSDRDQCASNADCAEFGSGLTCNGGLCVDPDGGDGPWGCGGEAEIPDPPQVHTLRRSFRDIVTNAEVDVTVSVCGGIDTDCMTPLMEGLTPDPETDILTLQLSSGFEGFLEVRSSTHLPALQELGPVAEDELEVFVTPMLTLDQYTGFAAAVGVELDFEASGHLGLDTYPCPGGTAAGVRYSLDRTLESTRGYYFDSSRPSSSLTQTDPSGRGGFVNLPAGILTLTASTSERQLGQVSFISRPGWFSYVGFSTNDVDAL